MKDQRKKMSSIEKENEGAEKENEKYQERNIPDGKRVKRKRGLGR